MIEAPNRKGKEMARNGKPINVKIATTKVIKALETKLVQIRKDKENQKVNEAKYKKAVEKWSKDTLKIALANIALPLTNSFTGELLMFTGLYQKNLWYAVSGGLGVILSAVYTLNMIQKVAYGPMAEGTTFKDLSLTESLVMAILVLIILVFGFYPQPILHLANLG